MKKWSLLLLLAICSQQAMTADMVSLMSFTVRNNTDTEKTFSVETAFSDGTSSIIDLPVKAGCTLPAVLVQPKQITFVKFQQHTFPPSGLIIIENNDSTIVAPRTENCNTEKLEALVALKTVQDQETCLAKLLANCPVKAVTIHKA